MRRDQLEQAGKRSQKQLLLSATDSNNPDPLSAQSPQAKSSLQRSFRHSVVRRLAREISKFSHARSAMTATGRRVFHSRFAFVMNRLRPVSTACGRSDSLLVFA